MTLPGLTAQYVDYAKWQRDRLNSPVIQNQVSYWKSQLSGTNGIIYPRSADDSIKNRGKAHTTRFSLSSEQSVALKKYCESNELTPYMLLLSSFYLLLNTATQKTDIAVTSPIANRTHPEIEHLIGYFVNTLVLRVDLSKTAKVEELIALVKKTTLDAQANQDVPFDYLIGQLELAEETTSSLLQTRFVMQNIMTRFPMVSDFDYDFVEVNTKTAKFDLMFTVYENNGTYTGAIEYRKDVFSDNAIDDYIKGYLSAVDYLLNVERDSPLDTHKIRATLDQQKLHRKKSTTKRFGDKLSKLKSKRLRKEA